MAHKRQTPTEKVQLNLRGGLPSTFRDQVADWTDGPGEMAAVALAHRIMNAVAAAYRRGDMVEKRHTVAVICAGFLTAARYENA